MNINANLLTRNLNALIYKYNQLAIEYGEPVYTRPLLPPNARANESMLRFEYGLVSRKLKRLLRKEDTGNDDSDGESGGDTGGEDGGNDTRVQSVDLGVTIEEFKVNPDGITVDDWIYAYDHTKQVVVALYVWTATGELELKLSDMPAEECKFTGGESLSVDRITFNGCSDLTKLTLRDWDLGDIDNMRGMFAGCSSMITVDGMQNWDTSKVEDMSYMFYECPDLSEFGENTWNTGSVKRMSSMFQDCTSLTNVDGIQKWDTSKVEKLGNMFNGCKELTAIDLSKWDTSLVTDATDMLLNCDKLDSLTINSSVYDTFKSATDLGIDLDNWYYLSTSVGGTNSWGELGARDEAATIVPYQTTILKYDGVFESLSTDIISGSFKYFFTTDITGSGQVFNAQLVDTTATTPPTDAPYMVIQDNNDTLVPVASYANICGNSRMQPEIDVSNWDTRNVNDMSAAFDECIDIATIRGLDKWNTSKVKDMNHMFGGSHIFDGLNGISSWDTSKVEDMSGMFVSNELYLYFPYVSKWNISNLRNATDMFRAHSINALMLNSWIARDDLNITEMFKDTTSLHALTITESMFNQIKNNANSGIAFTDWYYGSTKIGTQSWSDLGLNTTVATFTKYIQNEKRLDGEFTNNRDPIKIDNWSYTGHIYGSNTWQYLSVKYFDKTDTEIPTEKPYTSIRASDNTALTVDSASGMFIDMTALTTADMSGWRDYMLQVWNITELFRGCTSLTSVNLTGLWHSNMIEAGMVLANCTALTDIVGLDTWMTNGSRMRSLYAFFYKCTSLTQINGISSWDTSKMEDMFDMFRDCSSLVSLDLSGWQVADDAGIVDIFNGCTALTSIRIKKSASRLLTEFPGNITYWYIRLPGSYAQLANTDWNDEEWGTETPRIFYKGGPSVYELGEDFPDTYTPKTIDGWEYIYAVEQEYYGIHIANSTATAIPSDMPYNYFKNSSEQIAPVRFSYLCTGASSLTDVSNLVDLPVRWADYLDNMFLGCTELTTITSTANWDVRGVISFQNMFATGDETDPSKPSVLKTVDLSGWDLTTQDHVLTNMFDGCVKLQSVKISKTGAKILTVLPGEITEWKVNNVPLTDTNWNSSWGDGPIELTRDVA